MKKIGFIGCGNMGGALARAAARSLGGESILLSDADTAKAQALATELGAAATDSMTLIKEAYCIVLGVKPQMLGAALAPLKDTLRARGNGFFLVSMLAGTSMEKVSAALEGNYPIIRIMPNTPASVGEGMILYATADTSADAEAFFLQAFSKAGKLDKLPEGLIDAASALSGCGPAFVCLFAEALADGAVACGLPRDKANAYAAQTLLGTAKLLLESGKHPGVLKDAVCSPGGTTIEGVRALEEGALRGTVMDAVTAAYEKTLALGK